MPDILNALVLGIVEGLTEFIPVSSTAHLILMGKLLGFGSAGTFDILIQLGAILAVVIVYFERLLMIARQIGRNRRAQHFVVAVLLGFLPAAVIGALTHDFIKSVLFDAPTLICIVLILGGLLLIAVDRMVFNPVHHEAMDFSWPMAVKIGFFQCLALVPGVSRSGSTIVGALLLGADRRSAAEFSFFLAMPTMLGAFTLDLYKSRHELDFHQGSLIAIGFVAAFFSALIVVRGLLNFVSKHGYGVFGIWRILVGAGGLLVLTWPW
ncbi:undecaprenyl-diphosphate phosphatase [Rhizobium sp. BK376]|uniref:undecaprenyl-diphosphate phosphatase n=1 Tax=Rhizobium sp. BK376 TaxID=2512149 RepID=UPI001051A604|nr:undecaprenyl-diphosphate phosphatase [Rhizobium sp. BK376]TCR85265.1 undecaprenyl-diphosphatase [Rhizobium sp. BK376]